jgi:hypothetical protein
VKDLSAPAVIQMVDVALRYYLLTRASEPKLTIPEEVQETIRVSRSARLRSQTV